MKAPTGPSTTHAAIYRKPLEDDAPFSHCTNGLPKWFYHNIETHCLAASGTKVVFGTGSGALYLSLDTGENWNQLLDDMPPIRSVAFG